ncbi:Flagellar hook-length control protein FliK [Geodermatophilus obscurus]|uniref:Flagellar hook-length control protein FliK n=1 Tax=Geodermatophilus obscurus TaxID=1861 RepID=A0A1M7T281_9ACTN|nr:flagellar hook-length control protein FliK [Geodermatophilus obscurus]SHN64853.1 Flagellar hook-length control protein FliK [Geodermatophilus obscurus]
MTAPLAPAAPAPAPAAASPAATDSPGGAERFASALDDAVAGEQSGPRGQERAAETDGAPAGPAPEVPAGDQPPAEQPVAGQPALSGAGMPPGLWALLTGIGPAAAGPAIAVDPAAAGSAVGTVASAVATGTAVLPSVALPVVPDGVPAAVPPAGIPAPAPTGLPAGAVPVPDAPAADAVLPTTPGPVPATATVDPLPGITVVLAGADAPGTPTAPELVTPDSVVPLPRPAAAPAPAQGPGADPGSAPDQDAPVPALAPAAGGNPAVVAAPAVPTTAPAPTAGPAAPAAPAPPVSGQVAQQVAVLRSAPDGTHTMTLVLTPETLGPVEVQVTLSQGSVDLALKSATEAGRAALLEALPDLRRDLASAGLTCTNASVDRDAGGAWASTQQQATGDRAGQQGQPDGRSRPWLRGADADPGRPDPTATPSSGLDVRV